MGEGCSVAPETAKYARISRGKIHLFWGFQRRDVRDAEEAGVNILRVLGTDLPARCAGLSFFW